MDTFYHPVFAPSSVKEHCLHFSEKDFNATFFTVHTRQNRTLPNNTTTAQNGVTVKSNGTSRKITRRQKQNIELHAGRSKILTLCKQRFVFLGGSQGEGVTKFAFVHVVCRHMKNEGKTHTVFAETGRNFHIFQNIHQNLCIAGKVCNYRTLILQCCTTTKGTQNTYKLPHNATKTPTFKQLQFFLR